MRVHLSTHAVRRAYERLAWNPKQAVEYWFRHVDMGVFNQGPGVYNLVMDGALLWTAAFDPEKDEIRILSLAHAKPFNETGFCGPLRDRNGEMVSYSTRVEMAGPGRIR